MASNPAFGKRFGERLREMGYWPAGRERPDVYRFALKCGYAPSAIYRWLEGEVPRTETFLKLCQDLQRPAHYLLADTPMLDAIRSARVPKREKAKVVKAKIRMAKPIGGGSGAIAGLHVVQILDNMSLIGRWLRDVFLVPARPLLLLQCNA